MKDLFFTKGIMSAGRALAVLSAAAVIFCFAVFVPGGYEAYADEKKDETVSFTVYHQDTSGKELADPQVFYGNIGDKPVITSVEVKGYVPQVKQITRTISENSEENVFTFVYDKAAASGDNEAEEDILDIDETKKPLADPGKPQAGMRESGNGMTVMLAVTCLAVLAVYVFWRRKKKHE